MIKSIAMAVWSISITLGVFTWFQMQPAAEDGDVVQAELHTHKTPTMAIALFREGRVIGHLVTRVELEVTADSLAAPGYPLDAIIEDALFTAVQAAVAGEAPLSGEALEGQSMQTRLKNLLQTRQPNMTISSIKLLSSEFLLKSKQS
ncbi:MAG: hypothetical protein AAGF28_00925 [Pseudomonadota bacterium]